MKNNFNFGCNKHFYIVRATLSIDNILKSTKNSKFLQNCVNFKYIIFQFYTNLTKYTFL